MRVLLVTDSFPPHCGGSGWSTYELARGLRARGVDVGLVRPRPGAAHDARHEYDGFAVDDIAAPAPRTPFVRNYFKNERLWRHVAARLAGRLAGQPADIVHGQHVLSTVPAVRAARSAGIPAVATVRDYWPVCYWSDLIRDRNATARCPACTPGNMRRCLHTRAGAASPIAWPLIPYMRANLARKRRALADADAVIAVSTTMAEDLAARVPELRGDAIRQIPNPVDLEAIRSAAARSRPPIDGPYAVFSGKLEPNKGAQYLLRVVARAKLPWPLLVVGDGRLRAAMESDARAAGIDARFLGWLPREAALGCVAHARLLLFPSHGPESLSRVLLEAGALGVPVAAMDTGGTRDIIRHGVTGLLSADPDALAADAARLVADRDLADTLARQLRAHVEATFAAPVVVDRILALYSELVQARAGAAHG
ncbi:MAG TPA: glycosyltransferase family 4 protein [Vicinamibacterales bacterium]